MAGTLHFIKSSCTDVLRQTGPNRMGPSPTAAKTSSWWIPSTLDKKWNWSFLLKGLEKEAPKLEGEPCPPTAATQDGEEGCGLAQELPFSGREGGETGRMVTVLLFVQMSCVIAQPTTPIWHFGCSRCFGYCDGGDVKLLWYGGDVKLGLPLCESPKTWRTKTSERFWDIDSHICKNKMTQMKVHGHNERLFIVLTQFLWVAKLWNSSYWRITVVSLF